jgi:hypothetical protein
MPHHIRDFRHNRSNFDHTTAGVIATSPIHSEVDYCNTLLINLPSTKTNRLLLFLIAAARAVIPSLLLLNLFIGWI